MQGEGTQGSFLKKAPLTPKNFHTKFPSKHSGIHSPSLRMPRSAAACSGSRQTSLCPPHPEKHVRARAPCVFDGVKRNPTPFPREPRREGCGGEELRRLRCSSPPQSFGV